MSTDTIRPGALVPHVFGGVRAAARAIGVDPSRVSRWSQIGTVPGRQMPRILEAAWAQGIDLTPHELVFGRPRA